VDGATDRRGARRNAGHRIHDGSGRGISSARANASDGARREALVRATSATDPIGIYRLERWRASLRYYIGRPVARLESVSDVGAFMAGPRPVYIVMLRREYDELRKSGVPLGLLMQHRAVEGTTGRGLRRQRWGFLVVATNAPSHRPDLYLDAPSSGGGRDRK